MNKRITLGLIVATMSVAASAVLAVGSAGAAAPTRARPAVQASAQADEAPGTEVADTKEESEIRDPVGGRETPDGVEGSGSDEDTHEDPDGADVNHECPGNCDTARGERG